MTRAPSSASALVTPLTGLPELPEVLNHVSKPTYRGDDDADRSLPGGRAPTDEPLPAS